MVHVQRAGQVDGDQPLPLRRLGLDERAEHVPAGVVDQHVDGAQFLLHRSHRRIDAGAIGDVAAHGQRAAAGIADLRRHAFACLRVQVEHADRRPGARKAQTGCAADTATTAGHDDRLAFESLHSRSPFRVPVLSCRRCRRHMPRQLSKYVDV
ncbi:hypothetical protein D3C81_1743530 [compost metagenome]